MERHNRPVPKHYLYHADFNKLNSLLASVNWEEILKDLDTIIVLGISFLKCLMTIYKRIHSYVRPKKEEEALHYSRI